MKLLQFRTRRTTIRSILTRKVLFERYYLVLGLSPFSPESTVRGAHSTMPRAWRLRTRPEGEIKDTDLEMCDEPKPAAEEGQLVVKNMYIRCGPSLFAFLLDL